MISDRDLSGRFEVVVDHDAEPADLDEALADFLLRIVSKRCSAETPATELAGISGGIRSFCDDEV